MVTFSVTALRGNLGKFAFNVETGSTFWVMAVIAAHKTHFKNLILPPKKKFYLLAPQSGALRINAFRDFQPIPSHPTHPIPLIAFEHLSLYTVF